MLGDALVRWAGDWTPAEREQARLVMAWLEAIDRRERAAGDGAPEPG